MNRSKLIKCILSAIPILATIMYGGGYIAQLFGNYSLWQKNGGSMGDGTAPRFPSTNVKVCLNSLFSFPYGLIGIAVCIGAMAVLILLIMKMGAGERTELDRERNFEYSSKGTYGTSGFMSEKEMYEIFDVDSVKNNTGILLGEYKNKAIFLPKESYMNKNIAVFGASGSMKSRAFVRNYIFQATRRGESLVITDPKSEMYEDMAVYLENQGYEVKVFNLVSPQNSDSWNCIADINGDDLMAQTFTDVVIKNTTVGMGDEFWDSASVNLLKALVLYISVEFPNIGAIPDFKKKISTTRSRAINISVIFQNLAQLQNRYPDGAWQEILGNCDTQLFLGCTDDVTAKLVADRTGEVTVAVASKTKTLNSWRISDYTPEYREARSLGKRKLLTPDEILRLPVNEALVIMRGQKVLKVTKFDYTKHPHANMIIKEKASSHIPKWREAIENRFKADEKQKNEVNTDETVPKRITFGKKTTDKAPAADIKEDGPQLSALDRLINENKGGDCDGNKPKFSKIDKSSITKK